MTQGYREVFWGLIHEPGPLFIWLTLAVSALPAEVAIVLTLKSLKHSENKAEYTQHLLVALGSGVAPCGDSYKYGFASLAGNVGGRSTCELYRHRFCSFSV